MAMKLNDVEKRNDSIIRTFNKQIENAYRKLGVNHTVTQNLVKAAKSIYGDNLKSMKITIGYSPNQVDKSTGEIRAIPQIPRTRATLSQSNKARELKNETKYATGSAHGVFKSPYNVTKAHQRAVKKAMQKATSLMPDELAAPPSKTATSAQIKHHKQKQREFMKKAFTNKAVREVQDYDDLASEVWEKYTKAVQNKASESELNIYRDFANYYHSNKLDANIESMQYWHDNIDDLIARRLTEETSKELTSDELSALNNLGVPLNEILNE